MVKSPGTTIHTNATAPLDSMPLLTYTSPKHTKAAVQIDSNACVPNSIPTGVGGSGTIGNVLNTSAEANAEALFGRSPLFVGIPHYYAQLQKGIDLVREYLIQAKYDDIPFTHYLTKKQKKKKTTQQTQFIQHSIQGWSQ